MEVVKYLKENSLESLKETFHIRVKEYDSLVVLNYHQIQSPTYNSVVKECRGLILDYDWNVVSRSFDRFYNIDEEEKTFDISLCHVFEKIDGSLIKIYNYKDHWYISTRGTAYAECEVGDSTLIYRDMVLKALELTDDAAFQEFCNENMDKSNTYIFEVTDPENRIVTRYEDCSLWFLAVRHNQTGMYKTPFMSKRVKYPKCYKFTTIQECISAAKALPDLQEGYVVYNQDGVPICKVKSPVYVAAFHLRGEGITPSTVCKLIAENEYEEYLKYFPDDVPRFAPYLSAMQKSFEEAEEIYSKVKNLPSQKEFALQIKGYPWASYAFKARKNNKSVLDSFNESDISSKVKYLLNIEKFRKG